MKKILSLLYVALLPLFASAYDAYINGIYYNISGDEATVTYQNYGSDYSDAVVIPSTVTYNGKTYSVTSIGKYAFYESCYLTSVTIPNSVTSIGFQAFYNCSSLTSVTIPNSVTSIGERAFYDCSSLTFVTIGNSVTSIGEYAFHGCSGLKSINIPNSVTSIGNYAFEGCSGLTSPLYNSTIFAYMPTFYEGSYRIPNGIKVIEKGAFRDCSGLTSITIPNSVTSIGNVAFHI